MPRLIVTATDTDVGKTVFAAALLLALGGVYWKPIQAGRDGGTDTERVRRLTGLGEAHFRAERYVLGRPLSPHRAAELDGVAISAENLDPPADVAADQPLIIEGAGGVLVPISRQLLQAELFRRWQAPVIVCARTRLGTINHSLLTLEALRRREVPILGLAFIGEAMPDSERTIAEFAGVAVLGRLPWLEPLTADGLARAFAANFAASFAGTFDWRPFAAPTA